MHIFAREREGNPVNGNHFMLCKFFKIPHPKVKEPPNTVWKLVNPTMGILTTLLPGNIPCEAEMGTNPLSIILAREAWHLA